MLKDVKAKPDVEDFKKRTPFNLASSHVKQIKTDFKTTSHSHLFGTLLSLKVHIDKPDSTGRTAFLNYFAQN